MLASPAFVDVEIPPHVTCISCLEPAPVATRHKELVAIYFYFIIIFFPANVDKLYFPQVILTEPLQIILLLYLLR